MDLFLLWESAGPFVVKLNPSKLQASLTRSLYLILVFFFKFCSSHPVSDDLQRSLRETLGEMSNSENKI